MKNFTTAVLATLATGIFAAGANAAGDAVSNALQDAKKGVFDLIDKETVTVDFDKGASAVTQGDKDDLKALYEAVKADAKIEKVIVAAWSDAEYPEGKDQKLTSAERELAEARAKNVKAALVAMGAKNVETFSMAEHPSWIARTFGTEDAKIKGTAEPKSVDDAVLQQIGKELRSAGGPGKAVVFLRRQGEKLSH